MMKIRHAEDFGVAFDMLAREYRRTASRELLELMNRTCDRYLQYFSLRTLSCALRALQPVFAFFPEPTPMEDEADFARYVQCNNLLEVPLIENFVEDELPIEADLYKDFVAIVQYLQNYAEGRLSYMPQLAKDFLYTFIIRCDGTESIIQEGKLVNDAFRWSGRGH